MSNTNDFDEILRNGGILPVSAWQAAWREAEELLEATAQPGVGYDVLEIGRIAWDRLPEDEKAEALDNLFYAYWSSQTSARENAAARGGEQA
jgi:hypothetical protein